MYTNPAFARQGVGRLILTLCEKAAAAEGFTRLELMGTLSGQPLYTAYGFAAVERIEDDRGGAPVPLFKMAKPASVNVTLYTPGRRSTIKYCPLSSVVAVRTRSIKTGLAASTLTPGRIPPLVSRTTPPMAP